MIASLAQQILNGLLLGATYELVGAGFAVTYGISRVLNFAHGAFFVVGSYGVYAWYSTFGLPLGIAFVLGSVFVLPIAIVSYYVVIRPYGVDKSSTALLGTFGATIVILEGLRQIFGPRLLVLPRLVNMPTISLSKNIHVSYDQAVVALAGICVLSAGFALLHWTGVGRRLRAIVQSPEAAQLIGINPEPYRFLSFVLGSWLSGVAGAGLAFLAPIGIGNGVNMTFVAFVIVVLAGLGNIGGAVIVAFVLAVVQALSSLYVRAEISLATPYLFMVLVLVLKPRGLFPTRA